MRAWTWISLALLLACGPKAAPEAAATADVGASERSAEATELANALPVPPPPPAPPRFGTLSFAETWPVETNLDEPEFPEVFETWPELIGEAEASLDISQFYVSNDPEGESRLDAVLAAVEEAAGRGVAVRFLADAKFYKTYPEILDQLDGVEGIEVRIYDMAPHTGGVQHAKYFLVDGRSAWVGSQNFDWRSLEHIAELGFRLDSPMLTGHYTAVFELDWALAGGASLDEARRAAGTAAPQWTPIAYEDDVVQALVVASPEALLPHEAMWDLPHLLEAIASAEERIRIHLLSYAVKGYDKTEWRVLDDALRQAAVRGVQIELLVANWSKQGSKLEELQRLQRVEQITVKFANIPEWSGGFVPFSRVVHSKLMLVDSGWAWVGTSNWSKDYFHGSRNVGLVIKGEGAATEDLWRYSDRLWTSPYTEVVDPDKTDYVAPKVR